LLLEDAVALLQLLDLRYEARDLSL